MLTKVSIIKLFGIYTYTFNLKNNDLYPLRYITGPNGYGKTTILNLINALMTQRYTYLFEIEFTQLSILMNDNIEFIIKQNRTYYQAEDSDAKDLFSVSLDVNYKSSDKVLENFIVTKGETWGGMTEMFFQTYPFFYINDKRNVYLKSDYKENSIDDICARLREDTSEFIRLLDRNSLEFPFVPKIGEIILEEEYTTEVQSMYPQIEKMKQWGIVKQEFRFMEYFEVFGPFLRHYLTSIRQALQSEFVKKLEMFVSIIDSFEFSNKHLEISPHAGFYFVMDDDIHSPLTPEQLSSGEQHILLQVYELLFAAAKQSLVLIDEPELSSHMYWQMIYSQQIEKIANEQKLQCVIATHSPQIFNQIWEHTIDLHTLSNVKEN